MHRIIILIPIWVTDWVTQGGSWGTQIKEFYIGLDPAIKAAIIGSITTAVTGFAGFWVLLWRLRREAQHAINELRQAEAMKLKLRIYEEEVIEAVSKISDAEVTLSNYIRRFEMDLTTYNLLVRKGLRPVTPTARVPTLIDLYSSFTLATIDIVTFVETWLVVDPRLSIFQIAINVALHDAQTAWGAYFDCARSAMPLDSHTGIYWIPPEGESYAGAITAGNVLIDRLSTAGAYASDFRVEMQVLLIGPIFGNNVASRQPIDPRHLVITLSDAEALASKFEASAWGIKKKEIEDRVRDALKEEPPKL